jgi:hypothetical protein
MRVVDESLFAIDDGVTRNPQRQSAVVDPIIAVSEAISRNASVVEREDVWLGFQDTEILEHAGQPKRLERVVNPSEAISS